MEEKKIKRIGAYKVLSDSTLKGETKADLIERIRILEHNWAATEEALDNSYKNGDRLLAEQKAEIERLTEEKYKLEQNLGQCENGYQLELHTERYKSTERQKQVDELTFERDCTQAENERLINLMDKAVKDTAKEIYILAEDYNCGYEIDMDNFMKELKERYGVEVDE